ncbi:hypothetical protein [Candidatus Clostridium helianthi]|uniref:Helix-turn-helix domain-containing protein n=1 Tax=Candidatus Clostridium helianthi TaxID=3381660 RepID=A0ABW8S331_9CLOT
MNGNENIFFRRFDGTVRKVFFDDKDKYMVLSWIIFKTNYQDDYQGLKRNECYFSYSVVENECNVSRRKLQRILLDLEREGFIAWIHRSKAKNQKSIIFLIETGYGSENGLGYGSEYGKSMRNTDIIDNQDTVGDTVGDTVKDTSSRNISKNISNNIYSHWNSKKIIVHKSLNKDIEKAIENALKKYSEEEIVRAIETYNEILKDDGYYFNYKWGLKDFLSRSNGISTFMNDGSNKVNYEDHKKKSIQTKKVVNYDSYID